MNLCSGLHSARPLHRAKATDDSLWWISQSCRILRVATEVNSGPPSEASSSGTPKVLKVLFSAAMSPVAPDMDFSTIGQFENRSTITM